MPKGIPNNPLVTAMKRRKKKNKGSSIFHNEVTEFMTLNPGIPRNQAMKLVSAKRKGHDTQNVSTSPITGEITPHGVVKMVTKRRSELTDQIEKLQGELDEWNKFVPAQATE